jgi:nicotinamide-nucleotide adenylyltransferase
LLSVKNVDKALKVGDATYLQRLQMMGLLAQDPSVRDGNVAIAITDEPTFVGKSKVLQEYLKARLASLPPETTPQSPVGSRNTQLSFIVGLDTLERLFSPKYYPPSSGSQATHEDTMIKMLSRMLSPPSQGGDDSLVVCARRITTLPSDVGQSQSSTLDLGEAEGWMKKGVASGVGANSDSRNPHVAEVVSGPEHCEIPKDERIVIIDIGDRASKFSSTAVRNARGRIGAWEAGVGEGPWREWVSNSVASYVEEEGLYVS